MASPNTLQIRDAQKANKAQRKAVEAQAKQRQEGAQAAAQLITSLAGEIYTSNVALWTGPSESPEALFAYYEAIAHKSMDAAIAFVRASNSYDDRAIVPKAAPPIVAEQAPVDANGTPVDA